MDIVLDYKYFLASVSLGLKEGYCREQDIHPLMRPYVRSDEGLERELLRYLLLFDHITFSVPRMLIWDCHWSMVGMFTLEPFMEAQKRCLVLPTPMFKTADWYFSAIYQRLFGQVPRAGRIIYDSPISDEELNCLIAFRDYAIGVTASMGVGPDCVSDDQLLLVLQSIRDRSTRAFQSALRKDRGLVRQLRVYRRERHGRYVQAYDGTWENRTKSWPAARDLLPKAQAFDYEFLYPNSDPAIELGCSADTLELLRYISYLMMAAHEFVSLFSMQEYYSPIDPNHRLAFSPSRRSLRPLRSQVSTGFYCIAIDRFLDGGIFLPSVDSLKAALFYREKDAISAFRLVVTQWQDAVSRGAEADLPALTRDLQLAAGYMKRMSRAAKLNSFLTLSALPVSVAELAMNSLPIISTSMTLTGFALESHSLHAKARNRWIELLR